MLGDRSIWVPLLVPGAIGSVPVALGAYWWLGSLGAVVAVAATGICCTLATGVMVARWHREAAARLHQPALRGASQRGTGIFRSLLQQACSHVAQLENENREIVHGKTELEAKTRVRRKETRRLETALNALEQPVVITDNGDTVQFCNVAARSLFRSAAGGEAETADIDLNAVPQLRKLIELTRSRNAATASRKTEFEIDIGGETAAYRATAVNVFGEHDGAPVGVVTVLADIGDERDENTRHAEFVSSVCHELKTPMSSIKAFVEMLMDGDVEDPDEQRELCGFIDVQVDRLTRLVNNMLNLTRIQSGVIQVEREDCELNGILNKALDVVRPRADEKQIRLVSELSDLYLAVHVDRDLFGQAVINLLSNAVKYTPEGGEVRMRSRMDENRAVIEVRDNGMGIPEESLSHIFDRFYRVPQNNKAAAGSGLGLALVQYITTELHNGQISVDSTVNEGTCFTITIPLGHLDQGGRKQERNNESALCPA